MSSIQRAVDKYSRLQQKDKQQKEIIYETISSITGIHIEITDIEIHNKKIRLNISSIKKNNILGHKDSILLALQNTEHNKEIQEIQ